MEKLNAASQARSQMNTIFIIDGYPSSLDRAESFEKMVSSKHFASIMANETSSDHAM